MWVLHTYVKFFEQIIFEFKKIGEKYMDSRPFWGLFCFVLFQRHYGPWLTSALVNVTWPQAQSIFYENVSYLSNLILITETEQRDISIWFWWMWSACTLKQEHSGKDWKFLLRNQSLVQFSVPDTCMLQVTLETYSSSSTYFLDYNFRALCFILGYI